MDTRSRREKLRAMANQAASPAEAAIARVKLAALEPDPSPPTEQFRGRFSSVVYVDVPIKFEIEMDGIDFGMTGRVRWTVTGPTIRVPIPRR